MRIDYSLLAKAQQYYSIEGFQYIEAPWTVSQAALDITRPLGSENHYHISEKKKNLVASGEQSFVYLMIKGYLQEGFYQCITPCFREDSYDLTHCKQFIKNELIYIG